MKCSVCNADVIAGAVFCPQCGKKMEAAAGNAPAASDPVAPADKFNAALAPRDDSVHDQEHELWQGSYSWKAMLGSWLLAALATAVLIVVSVFFPPASVATIPLAILLWLGLIGYLLYRRLSVHYMLTSQRLVHNAGILVRTTDRIEVIDMEDVTFFQGIVQRMLGVGTIKITSQDRTHPEIWLVGIDEVQRISLLIDDVRRKERRRRGIQMVQ